MMEGVCEDLRASDNGLDNQENEILVVKEVIVISVNALAGNQIFQTMRVRGYVNGKMIHILIDIGITHYFLD